MRNLIVFRGILRCHIVPPAAACRCRVLPTRLISYGDRTSWPRISPGLLAAVCMLTYHFPASRSEICASVRVAEPLIGLVRLPLNGTSTPALAPEAAGPWMWAAVAGPL